VSLSFALCPDGRWTAPTSEVAAAARAAGFSAIGVPVGRADATALAAMREHDVVCLDVLAALVTRNEERTLAGAAAAAAAAAAVHADWVLGSFGTTPATAEARALIQRTAAVIAESGARLAVEFSPLGPLTSLTAALEVVDLVGVDQAGVLIDTWHFCHGDSTWESLEQVPLDHIAYVQFDDALAPVADGWVETMDRRVFPGDGVLELERFARTLVDRGWDGVVAVEVLNAELSTWPVADFAQAAYAKTVPYWS
jgi:sugar phosphate isomerase/epimerase